MPSLCGKCKLKVPDDQIQIICQGCNNIYHVQCTTIKAATWKAKGKKDKEAWRCRACRGEEKQRSESESEEVSDDLSIKEMFLEIRRDVKILTKNQEDVKATMAEQSGLIKALTSELQAVKKDLAVKNREISSLKQELVDMQQYSRNRNLEIHNLPEKPDENLKEVVGKISEVLGVHIESGDIDVVHRIPSRNTRRPKPVIVQFVNRTVRNLVLDNKKNIVQVKDIYRSHSNGKDRILVYENLCPYYRSLLRHVREWGSQHDFKYVWFRNGAVLVKKSEKYKKVYVVKSVHDLEKIKIGHSKDVSEPEDSLDESKE